MLGSNLLTQNGSWFAVGVWLLRKRRVRRFEDDLHNLVWRGQQWRVVDGQRSYRRFHTLGHKSLCLGVDHSVFLGDEVPGRL